MHLEQQAQGVVHLLKQVRGAVYPLKQVEDRLSKETSPSHESAPVPNYWCARGVCPVGVGLRVECERELRGGAERELREWGCRVEHECEFKGWVFAWSASVSSGCGPQLCSLIGHGEHYAARA